LKTEEVCFTRLRSLKRVSGHSTLLSTGVEIYDTWIQPPSVFGLCRSLLKPQNLLHISYSHSIIPVRRTLADLLQFARGRQPSKRNSALDAQLNMNRILRRLDRNVGPVRKCRLNLSARRYFRRSAKCEQTALLAPSEASGKFQLRAIRCRPACQRKFETAW
jgi:hypothetical protein